MEPVPVAGDPARHLAERTRAEGVVGLHAPEQIGSPSHPLRRRGYDDA